MVVAVHSIQCSVFRMVMTLAKSSEFLLRRLKYVFLLFVLLNTEHRILNAKSLSVHGVIYPIEEQDPIALIQQKLKVMEDSGELARRNLELQKKVRSSVERPKPVEGITRATQARVFTFDPTYIVNEDLKDHQGNVFAKKGSKFNPLETVSLSQNLIFFNGDDEEQLAWVKEQLQKGSARLILTKGTPLALAEELRVPVYFDQNGVLIQKLEIHHVPAVMNQENLHLRIEEIVLSPSMKSLIEEDL